MKWLLCLAFLPSAVFAVSLSGKFTKKCTKLHPDYAIYEQKQIIFKPKSYTLINKKFENDPKCTNAISEVSLEVEYLLKNTKSKKEYNADLRIQKYFVTSLTPIDTKHKNKENFCEITWIPNKKVDATDLPCGQAYKNRLIYHKIHVADDNIFLGLMTQDADGSSPEKRPQTIDLSNPYVKAKN